jgi:hypothetical protein
MRPMSRRSLRTSSPVRRRVFRPLLSQLEDRTLLATVTWINPAGGDWDTAANWSSGALPGPSDDAVIAVPGIIVTHSSSASDSVSSLTISASDSTLDLSNGSLSIAATSSISGDLTMEGGTLSAAGTLTVSGSATWTGGTITGGGALAAEGGIAISGNGPTLNGSTLNNYGAATCSGSISVGNGATINNLAGASFDIQGDTSLNYSGGAVPTFNNESGATVTVANDGIGGTQMGLIFNNAGTINLQSGTLQLGGSFPGGQPVMNSGTVTIGPGTTLAALSD